MGKKLLRKVSLKILLIFTIMLFVLSPLKVVKAEENEKSKTKVEENNPTNYSTLWWALGISLGSLGLVFLNKKPNK